MRLITSALLVALIAVFAYPADAAPSGRQKQRQAAKKAKVVAGPLSQPKANEMFGFDNTPEHFRVGTSDWWRAMERQGRGGFGDNN